MPRLSDKPGQNPSAKVNPNIVPGAMIVAAALIAVIGTMLPRLIQLDEPEATWVPLIFYVVSAFDVLVALFFRAKLIKEQESSTSDGGTIQRQ